MLNNTRSVKTEEQLAEEIGSYYYDPYGWVMFSYPWGEPTLADGSPNALANKRGPEAWQKRLLDQLGEHLRENRDIKELGCDYNIWRSARASGHGVGKSAVVAWTIQFFMSTRPDTRIGVTANTANQLETKTWPELSKWHKMLINKHWFTWTATTYYFAQYPEDQRKNYMAVASTASEHNTEAFAGLHNEGKTTVVLFDEASGVIPKIWEVAQGSLTDGEGFFFAFGNPTQPTGEFADCFDIHADMYNCETIDARAVSHTNKTHINDLIKMWGIDSDRVKVRVLGQFPNQAFNGFISGEMVDECCTRELVLDNGAALIMMVDVARFGNDESVIGFRQGRDCRSRPFLTFSGLSTTKLARIVNDVAMKERPDAIIVEGTGVGAGVVDMLRDNYHLKVIEVHPGAPSSEPEHYVRLRDELWGKMRDDMVTNLCLPEDPILHKQLTNILYTFDRHEQRIKLESKEDMKERTGLSSPDRADTIALSYAVKIVRRDANLVRSSLSQSRHVALSEYDIFAA